MNATVALVAVLCSTAAGLPPPPPLEEDGGSEHDVRGEAIVHAPIAAVRAVVSDVERFPGIIPYVASAQVLARSDRGAQVYLREHVPLLNDYDEVVAVKVEHELGDAGLPGYVARWDLVDQGEPKTATGAVHMRAFSGRWELAPSGPNETLVHLTVHADTGTELPGWTSRLVSHAALPQVFRAVEKAARQRAAP